MAAFPCPCCGRLTLSRGPGAYELCPVCFWEDDPEQLRYPMSADGVNGVSLVEAQAAYRRLGAVGKDFKKKVRQPRRDEPLDDGWRPFDPAQDWTNPVLDGDQWPVNAEALYYWRPTYWNGDQHRLPEPPRQVTNGDRLLDHLRAVPELAPAIAECERRWGAAHPFSVCGMAGDLVVSAYREGDPERALRIVTALAPAVDATSPMYSPNCVHIAFLESNLERGAWEEPALWEHITEWPVPIRDALQEQQAHIARNRELDDRRHAEWHDLFRSGRGQPVQVVVERLRAVDGGSADARREFDRETTARIISDRWWLYRHPVDSLLLAWRGRAFRHPLRTLAWLRRPRFAG